MIRLFFRAFATTAGVVAGAMVVPAVVVVAGGLAAGGVGALADRMYRAVAVPTQRTGDEL